MIMAKDGTMPVFEIHFLHTNSPSHNGDGWSIRFVEAETAEIAEMEALEDIFRCYSEELLAKEPVPRLTNCKRYESWDALEEARKLTRPKSGTIRGQKEIPMVEEALEWLDDYLGG
jgi:hypothetical protein